MSKFFLLSVLIAGCAAQQSNNIEFPKRVSECDNSASCRALYEEAKANIANHNCGIQGKPTCDELVSNMNAAKVRLDSVSYQEDEAAIVVGKTTEQIRQQALEQRAQEQRDAMRLKKEFCLDTKSQRLKAWDDFAQYAKVYNDNKAWVERNCRKVQTTRQECATNNATGKRICRTEVYKVILNCGSNPRPLKLDGTKLNDTDILDGKFGSDNEVLIEELVDAKQAAEKQSLECGSL